ncbi:hypothetical protein [Jatrophihabitans endophyticus]|uniref:hypothetical protein n=1 Tax=Jatrophihabitans endophyticus TaxID=1206085 RepID=UPI0019F118A4|nr:hypothetical protein [Jatrophihabitans endophyticus]MBE7186853.1 hypothetical protein [Jatrophihabitans endophyticus]
MTIRRRVWATLGASALVATALSAPGANAAPRSTRAAQAPHAANPAPKCDTTTNTEYATGSSSAAIGWAGNHQAVVACLSGSFVVKDTGRRYGFGVYNDSPTTWTNAHGHLPALVTGFHRNGAHVTITNFGDRDVIGGHVFTVIYSRVAVTNPTAHAVSIDPQPSAGLVALDHHGDSVRPGHTVTHDYAVASDRFDHGYAYPGAAALRHAGGYDRHFAHMRAYWTHQLAQLTRLRRLPDPQLVQAYDTGFVYTQITRGGTHLKTGVNGYDKEYSHDVVGILVAMLTQGFRTDGTTTAQDLLLRLRAVVGSQAQYDDGIWKYSWPWAVYLQKTGNRAFVRQHFFHPGPKGEKKQPSIEHSAHAIAKARTGPHGIIEKTNDIDANGYWTIDDYSALMGLASYRWLAHHIGATHEYHWATRQYASLLHSVNTTLRATVSRLHLHYLPCSMVESNAKNRCSAAKDANWAAPFLFGRWAWDGYLFGAKISGPGARLIDPTYHYGFARLKGKLPANTYGGYGDTEYSTGYNAGYGEWGLAGRRYRSQAIKGYEFMIDHTQSGPYSWWESVSAPKKSAWKGSHPGSGGGSSPHAWGAADANLALLASLVTERGDGQLIVGRGVPNRWIAGHTPIRVTNVPIGGGQRLGIRITPQGRHVRLQLTGHAPHGAILFQLPAFLGNVRGSSAGSVNAHAGTVRLSRHTRSVVVTLRHRA